jgi:hypothetical protein
MKSNDIIVEYKIGDKARAGMSKVRSLYRGKDYNPQDPDGLNKGDPKFGYPETPETPETPEPVKPTPTYKNLPKSTGEASLTRNFFVEKFVDAIYDLVSSQLNSTISYVAKPGQDPDESQVSLQAYISNWYDQYTRNINIPDNDPFVPLKNKILTQMQENWDSGKFDTKLLAALGEQTYSFANAAKTRNTKQPPPIRVRPDTSPKPAEPASEALPNVSESSKRVAKLKKLLEK